MDKHKRQGKENKNFRNADRGGSKNHSQGNIKVGSKVRSKVLSKVGSELRSKVRKLESQDLSQADSKAYFDDNSTDYFQAESKIEGRNAVREALRSDRSINKIFILEAKGSDGKKSVPGGDSRLHELFYEAKDAKIPVALVPAAKLNKLSDTGNHQGIIAMAATKDYADAEEVIAESFQKKGRVSIMILDEIFDGRNLASVIRSCECCGFDLIVLPKRRSAALDAYVSRESAGALEYMPVARVNNLRSFVESLKKRDFWIYGLDAAGDLDYRKADISGNIALVLGSEGKGISHKLREDCDFLVSIPMRGNLNSLNAAVAAAIVAFEFSAKLQADC